MKFLGVADDKNDRTKEGLELFATHGQELFAKAFEIVVRDKYSSLFELRGDEAWQLDRDALISFFRGSDKTTAIVGGRQALTFAALAAIAGKRDAPKRASPTATPKPKAAPSQKLASKGASAKPFPAKMGLNRPTSLHRKSGRSDCSH